MNKVVIGLSSRPARPHRLPEMIPWNRFLGSLKVKQIWALMDSREKCKKIKYENVQKLKKRQLLPACLYLAADVA
jgi:hypothetical protein